MRNWVAILLVLVSSPSVAGVEMDLTVTIPSGSVTEQMKIYSDGGYVRMDDIGQSEGENISMVFLGDRFLVLNHAEQNYIVIDEAMMAAMGAQIDSVMAEMQAQMANMPPEQQAMMQQMMESQFGDMMGAAEPPPPPEIEAIGTDEWQGESCDLFAVYQEGVKTQEVCTVDLDDIEGSDDLISAFKDMTAFMQQMAESLPGGMAEDMMEDSMAVISELDGFPVITRELGPDSDGSESVVTAVADGDLDPAIFAAPAGYSEVDPFNP
ncbi:MAG: hypothetical protein AAF351_11310 [Pseudomonadota bacterium]